jgi:hypothetical protein
MKHWLTAILIGLLPATASAAEPVALHGFATLGTSCFDSDDADFVYDRIPKGPGRTRRCDAGLDSVLGVQADSQFTEHIGGSLQVVSMRTPSYSFRPYVSNANIYWQASNALTLRLGRVNNPMLLHSDHRLIHYSLPTLRVPAEVYGQSPMYMMDGLDARHQQQMGDWLIEYYGGFHRLDEEARSTSTGAINALRLRKSMTAMVSGQRGPWHLKAGYMTGKASYTSATTDMLFSFLRQLDAYQPGSAALAEHLELRNTPYHLMNLAASHDDDQWLFVGEIARRTLEGSYYRDSTGAYITIGRHLDPWMPYFTLAKRQTSGPTFDERAGLLSPYVTQLLTATQFDQKSLSIGVSRDLAPGVDLKLQFQWIRPEAGSWSVHLENHSPSYNLANPPMLRLISANISLVF